MTREDIVARLDWIDGRLKTDVLTIYERRELHKDYQAMRKALGGGRVWRKRGQVGAPKGPKTTLAPTKRIDIEGFLSRYPVAWSGWPTTVICSNTEHDEMAAREQRLRGHGYDGPKLDFEHHRRMDAWIAGERLRRRNEYVGRVHDGIL